jgi:polysaccharide biosynthesis/export protein
VQLANEDKEERDMKRSGAANTIKGYGSFPVWGILLLILGACSHQALYQSLNSSTNHQISADYQIGPQDVLEVLVWKNEALSKVVTVRPDGKISLPLVGDVQAAGLTAAQLNQDIAEKFKTYYKEAPQVSLIVQQVNSYVIYILGEVQHPNQYVVKRGTTFLQAISLAGGFTPYASTNNILIFRKGDENTSQVAFKIRYKDIFAGKYEENNILLKPDDTIIIQ